MAQQDHIFIGLKRLFMKIKNKNDFDIIFCTYGINSISDKYSVSVLEVKVGGLRLKRVGLTNEKQSVTR